MKNLLHLPNRDEWVAQHFGSDNVATMGEMYEEGFGKFKSHVEWVLGKWASRPGVEVKVEASEVPDLPSKFIAQPLRPIARENFRLTVKVGSEGPPSWVNSFVYLDGAFRMLGGTYPFWAEEIANQARSLQTNSATATVAGEKADKREVPRRIVIGGNVAAAKLKHSIPPVYPRDARDSRLQGTVKLHIIIGLDGGVKQIEVVSGHPMLTQAAINAVRQWKYEPTLLNGEPVEVDTILSIIFSLG